MNATPAPSAPVPASFGPLSLRAKAVIAFAAVALYFLAAGVVLSVQREKAIAIVEELESVNRVEATLARVNTFASQAVLRINEQADLEPPRRIVESVELEVESIAAGLGGLTAWYPQAGAMVQRLRAVLAGARAEPSRAAVLELRAQMGGLALQLDQLSRETRTRHDRMWNAYRATYDSVTLAAGVLFALGLCGFGGLVIGFFRRLAWDLGSVAERSMDVVRGYRGDPMAVTRRDEVGSLMESVNRMQTILRDREREIEVARQQRFHQEKMVAIGSLAAAVAHEINNPIAAIEGVAESIPVAPGADGPRLILEHTRRIAGITRQLSRLGSQRSTDPEWIDVNGLARATTSFMSYDPRLRAVRTALELDPAVPAAWAVDDHVTQVLMNLLINAADALAVVPAAERRIEVRTREREGFVELTVRDNGPGMARHVLDHAFDEGFTTKAEGSGIGLFMCRTLVEKGGGRIALASIPGEGTEVAVSLPSQPPPGVPPA